MPASYVLAAFYTIKITFDTPDGYRDLVTTYAGSDGLSVPMSDLARWMANPPELTGHRATAMMLIAHDAHPTRSDCGVGMILRSHSLTD